MFCGYVLVFSETANTEQEIFKTISCMLLCECMAPYTLIIPCVDKETMRILHRIVGTQTWSHEQGCQ
jgi:hypothetical protein